jgi:nitrogen fixation NifU-like protein
MDRQSQIEFLLDHYENPRHKHALDVPAVVQEGGNPGCGDVIKLYVKFGDRDGKPYIEAVSFEGEGCTISQASADLLVEMVQGKSLHEVEALDHERLMEVLGKEVVLNRVRCATLSLDTLKIAIRRYEQELRARSQSAGVEAAQVGD